MLLESLVEKIATSVLDAFKVEGRREGAQGQVFERTFDRYPDRKDDGEDTEREKRKRKRIRTTIAVVESIIALGSNVGGREGSLRQAIVTLGRRDATGRWSSVYETEPMYCEDQGAFLNCVVVVADGLEAMVVAQELKTIEEEMGRGQGGARYGPGSSTWTSSSMAKKWCPNRRWRYLIPG